MQFRVTGQNRETGARQIMEFEAENRAAAERKASQAGMNVTHLQVMATEEDHPQPADARAAHRGEDSGNPNRGGCIASLVLLLLVIAVAVYFIWPRIKAIMER